MTQPFDNRDWDLRQIAEKDAEIDRMKALLTRAADALESYQLQDYEQNLIAELRKAAE